MDYKQFIENLKLLPDNKSKINAIMQYFIDNVEYDYVTLEKAKVNLSDLRSFDEKYDCTKPEDVRKAISDMSTELKFSDGLVARIAKFYGKERVIPATPEIVVFGRKKPAEEEKIISTDCTQALFLTENPVEYKEGMITKGVCADFAKFITKCCADLDIDCKTINGRTTVGHVWNLIEGKHYDITYALFSRDKFNNWDKTKIEDWFDIDEEQLYELQPYRKIDKPTSFGTNY